MSKSKVILRFPTVGHAAGDTIEVESAVAEYLVENGHAVMSPAAPAEPKGK